MYMGDRGNVMEEGMQCRGEGRRRREAREGGMQGRGGRHESGIRVSGSGENRKTIREGGREEKKQAREERGRGDEGKRRTHGK